jgi:hypothetical protein
MHMYSTQQIVNTLLLMLILISEYIQSLNAWVVFPTIRRRAKIQFMFT